MGRAGELEASLILAGTATYQQEVERLVLVAEQRGRLEELEEVLSGHHDALAAELDSAPRAMGIAARCRELVAFVPAPQDGRRHPFVAMPFRSVPQPLRQALDECPVRRVDWEALAWVQVFWPHGTLELLRSVERWRSAREVLDGAVARLQALGAVHLEGERLAPGWCSPFWGEDSEAVAREMDLEVGRALLRSAPGDLEQIEAALQRLLRCGAPAQELVDAASGALWAALPGGGEGRGLRACAQVIEHLLAREDVVSCTELAWELFKVSFHIHSTPLLRGLAWITASLRAASPHLDVVDQLAQALCICFEEGSVYGDVLALLPEACAPPDGPMMHPEFNLYASLLRIGAAVRLLADPGGVLHAELIWLDQYKRLTGSRIAEWAIATTRGTQHHLKRAYPAAALAHARAADYAPHRPFLRLWSLLNQANAQMESGGQALEPAYQAAHRARSIASRFGWTSHETLALRLMLSADYRLERRWPRATIAELPEDPRSSLVRLAHLAFAFRRGERARVRADILMVRESLRKGAWLLTTGLAVDVGALGADEVAWDVVHEELEAQLALAPVVCLQTIALLGAASPDDPRWRSLKKTIIQSCRGAPRPDERRELLSPNEARRRLGCAPESLPLEDKMNLTRLTRVIAVLGALAASPGAFAQIDPGTVFVMERPGSDLRPGAPSVTMPTPVEQPWRVDTTQMLPDLTTPAPQPLCASPGSIPARSSAALDAGTGSILVDAPMVALLQWLRQLLPPWLSELLPEVGL